MAKSNTKTKPAFPGRSNAMGYEPGLSKLEWIVTQLRAAAVACEQHNKLSIEESLELAKKIIKACEDAEASDT